MRAQPAERMRRIGVLMPYDENDPVIRVVFIGPYEHANAPHAVPLLRAGREGQNDRRASERDYELSSCNRDSHWTPLRQVSTPGSGTIPCFGGCMNPLIQPPSRPDACYGSSTGVLRARISRPLLLKKADAAGPCR